MTGTDPLGFIFRWTKNVDATTVRADFGGATVRVDRGGLIDAAQTDGTSAITALEVDAATGTGTFRNVSFAQAGTINVVAAGTLKGKTVLPMTLESCTGAANLANWSVKINGETPVGPAVGAPRRARRPSARCDYKASEIGVKVMIYYPS